MAIKIPKIAEQPEVNLSRTNMLGAVQDVIGPNVDRITSLLKETADKKYANDIRLENIRVSNKINKYDSLLADKAENLKKWVAEQEDVLTEEQLAKTLSKYEQDQILFMNRAYQGDTNFKNAFEGNHYTALTNAKKILNDENTKRIFVEARKSWDSFKTTFDTNLTNVVQSPSMWAEYEVRKLQLQKAMDLALKGNVELDYDFHMAELEEAFWGKAVIGNHKRIIKKADGTTEEVVDNLAVLESLNDTGKPVYDDVGNQLSGKKTTWYGETMSNEMREKMIAKFDKLSDKQTKRETKENALQLDNLYKKYEPSALDGSVDIDIMRNDYWPDTPEALEALEGLIGVTILARNGELATESNVTELKEISNLVQKRVITSRYQKFWLPSEIGREEELMKNDKYSYDENGASISGRLGKTIGTSHIEMLQKLLTLDDSERLLLEQFNRWFVSTTPLIEGKLKEWDILSEYDVGQAEIVIRERFWKGLRDGKNPNDLLTEGNKDYIFADLDAWRITITEQAERIAQLLGNNVRIVNTSGETVTIPEKEYNGPIRDFKFFPNTEEGSTNWINSEQMQKWIFSDYPNNEKFSKEYTNWNRKFTLPPVIMAEYSKKSKIQRMDSVDTQIEKDAIYYDIDYELVPSAPKDYKGKNWIGVYKKENPSAITLYELQKLVEKEKLSRGTKRKEKRGTLNSDNKTRIETKILDNDKRFKKKKDGFYYWVIDGKVTNIKVDPKQVK